MENSQSGFTYLLEEIEKPGSYVRLCFTDLNGAHRSKLVSGKCMKKILTNGSEIYAGLIAFGLRMEEVWIPEVVETNLTNSFLQPDVSTLHRCDWVTRTDGRGDECTAAPPFHIYQVMCDLIWPNGQAMQAYPRLVVQRLLTELKQKYNYELYSGFEAEFRAFEPDSALQSCLDPATVFQPGPSSPYPPPPTPMTFGKEMYKTDILASYEPFFIDLDRHMDSIGVDIQEFLNENGHAQLECPLMPKFGMRTADDYFTFKQASKEIARKHGMLVTYMTKPLLDDSASGCHFNHSLWQKKAGSEKLVNVFYDPSDQDGLSSVARHWIGGLMEHLPAITGLCCPTVNCYRRLSKHLAPGAVNWDINDRFCAVRVKNYSETNTYIENRIPSSASCPYHVMAATLAAGMSGLDRKLEPIGRGVKPSERTLDRNNMLASSLKKALAHLKADKKLMEYIGSDFVDWFIRVKEGADLTVLSSVDVAKTSELEIAMERHEYLIYS